MSPVVANFSLANEGRRFGQDRGVYMRKFLAWRFRAAMNHARGSETCFLSVPNSDEAKSLIFPVQGSVQVQEDLMHLAFEVENMDEFATHLEKVGYSFSDGPTKSSSGSVFAFVDAPEGYEVEVIEKPAL